ncbi:MAG: membrane protein required for colicin V production [Gammaproteobacteria bacterium]|jgi:membrane protein required for colicin V production
MNWADLLVLTIIGISALISLFRGFVREALSLLGLAIAVWISVTFYASAAELLTNYLSVPTARRVLGFVGLFVVSLIVAGLVNHLIGKLVDKAGLTGTDRMLGVIFGALRGIVIVGLFVGLAGMTQVPQDPWWKESIFMPHFQTLAEIGVGLLPPNLAPDLTYASP